jgi:hypothetical protein
MYAVFFYNNGETEEIGCFDTNAQAQSLCMRLSKDEPDNEYWVERVEES